MALDEELVLGRAPGIKKNKTKMSECWLILTHKKCKSSDGTQVVG